MSPTSVQFAFSLLQTLVSPRLRPESIIEVEGLLIFHSLSSCISSRLDTLVVPIKRLQYFTLLMLSSVRHDTWFDEGAIFPTLTPHEGEEEELLHALLSIFTVVILKFDNFSFKSVNYIMILTIIIVHSIMMYSQSMYCSYILL